MGTFLSLSGVFDRSEADVTRCLVSHFEGRGEFFELYDSQFGGPDTGAIGEDGGNTTVLYPNLFTGWDDASKFLSSQLQTTVFSLHIHDGDLWMLVAFEKGNEVAWFNPMPNYWGEVSADDARHWSGDAAVIGRLTKVRPEAIQNYFVPWDIENETPTGKAYANDQFEYGTDWQMTDFMQKVGLPYPVRDDGTIAGRTFRYLSKRDLRAAQAKPSLPIVTKPVTANKKRPWWKLW